MIKLILATCNPGKLVELRGLMKDLPIQLATQQDYDLPAPEETGLTFVENAILKARYVAVETGLPALGDDSGLEVDALQGEPGIYSARYAGDHAPADAHIDKLLQALAKIPEAMRTARFRCVMALMRYPHDPAPILAEGVWEGRILLQRQGQGGFGYDPIFLPQAQTDGRSAAELNPDDKNQQSHRGRALAALRTQLLSWLS